MLRLGCLFLIVFLLQVYFQLLFFIYYSHAFFEVALPYALDVLLQALMYNDPFFLLYVGLFRP